jgi:hypothetical protein
MHVASQYGIHPNAGMLTEFHVADDLGGWIHIAGFRDDGGNALKRSDHILFLDLATQGSRLK